MDQIWPLIVAIMAGNILTVTFLWGLSRAFKIYDDRDLDRTTALALLVPLFFFGGGMYLYG